MFDSFVANCLPYGRFLFHLFRERIPFEFHFVHIFDFSRSRVHLRIVEKSFGQGAAGRFTGWSGNRFTGYHRRFRRRIIEKVWTKDFVDSIRLDSIFLYLRAERIERWPAWNHWLQLKKERIPTSKEMEMTDQRRGNVSLPVARSSVDLKREQVWRKLRRQNSVWYSISTRWLSRRSDRNGDESRAKPSLIYLFVFLAVDVSVPKCFTGDLLIAQGTTQLPRIRVSKSHEIFFMFVSVNPIFDDQHTWRMANRSFSVSPVSSFDEGPSSYPWISTVFLTEIWNRGSWDTLLRDSKGRWILCFFFSGVAKSLKFT